MGRIVRGCLVSTVAAVLCGLTFPVQSQVFKCTDQATGITTFTDKACPDNGVGDHVAVQKANSDSGYSSPEEIRQAAAERAAKRAANQANIEKWINIAEKQAIADNDDREMHGQPLGSQQNNSMPMPISPPEPTIITNCDQAGCWDNVGNRYNRAGSDNYFRDDGKFCESVGGNMQCN